jgi:hypothetical protein
MTRYPKGALLPAFKLCAGAERGSFGFFVLAQIGVQPVDLGPFELHARLYDDAGRLLMSSRWITYRVPNRVG